MLTKTIYVQVKANKNKYDFWIVGKALNKPDVFYVFVNLLSNQQNTRPEYYVVPSKVVYYEYERFEHTKQKVNPTEVEIDDIVKRIKDGETVWGIVWTTGVCVQKIREIAQNKNLKIRYDRNKGENFPFCFFIRKKDEEKYSNKWDLLFTADSSSSNNGRDEKYE